MALRLKANRRFPSVPVVTDDPKNHTQVLMAIKEAMEIGQRRTTDLLNSYIRVQDLVDLGLIDLKGNTTAIVGADLSQIANIGDLSGAAAGDFLRFDGTEWTNDQLGLTDITQGMVTQHQAALAIDWSQIANEPSEFPPEAHTHPWSDLTSVPALLDDIGALSDPGSDQLLFWDDSAGEIKFLQLGTNLSITDTTLNATGGGGVSTVNSGTGISVNNTDPENPIINLSSSSIASLALADSAMQPGDNVSDLTNDAGYLIASDLAAVALSGDYDDLINTPTIPPDISSATFITADDETATLANSLKLVAGSNVTFDTSTPGELKISASGVPSAHTHSADDITTGTLSDSRLSVNVARRDQANTFQDRLRIESVTRHIDVFPTGEPGGWVPLSIRDASGADQWWLIANSSNGDLTFERQSGAGAFRVNGTAVSLEGHGHSIADISGLSNALADKLDEINQANDWNDVTNQRAKLIAGPTNGPDPDGSTNYFGASFAHTVSNYHFQIAGRNNTAYMRTMENGAWGSWHELFHTGHLPDWSEIAGKPATFTPSAHTHSAADITSGTLADGRLSANVPLKNLPNTFTQPITIEGSGGAEIFSVGFPNGFTFRNVASAGGWARGLVYENSEGTRLAGIGFFGVGSSLDSISLGVDSDWWLSSGGLTITASAITWKGTALSLAGHTHAISDVTNLQTTLNGKANLSGATFTGPISAPTIQATSSDARLKEDVIDLRNCLATVMKLRPRAWRWKQSGESDFGFIAQEHREVIPEAVHEGEDGMLYVRYGKAEPLIVGALQEIALRLSVLEARVSAIEER